MKTKIFILLFALMSGVGLVSAEIIEHVQIDELYYNLDTDSHTAEVASNDGLTLENISIPASLDYAEMVYTVTGIGASAFRNCFNLKIIEIPNSVTSIITDAISNCPNVENLVVNEGNSTYDSRNNCNAIIETSTNTLICGCKTTIIPNDVSNIGDYAFYFCKGLTHINIPDGVTTIGQVAFSGCGLTGVDFPNSLTSIGNDAFQSCNGITSITIPNKVTYLGVGVFNDCKGITSIVVEEGNDTFDSRNNCNAIIQSNTNTLIIGCQNTVIPNNITRIDNMAFRGCNGPSSIVIPYGVTSIGESAFMDCGMTSIEIPNSVTSIENEAFRNCFSLTSISLPSSVTSIGNWAFSLSGLTSITCQAITPPTCNGETFSNVNMSIPLYVPATSISAYQAADQWSEFTNIQAIPGTESSGSTPLFPDDPGTMIYKLDLFAAVVDGDSIAGQAPEGAGGYPAGTSVILTARDIPGYEFVQWSDSVTDKTRTIVMEKSDTLIAYYNPLQIEIAVAANQWTFFCLPPLGDKQYTADIFAYEGLTDVQWGTYNSSKRAEGRSGWETTDTYNATQGYIIYSSTAGTLRINAYQNEIRQDETAGNGISVVLSDYSSVHVENANWNFVGNPYGRGFNIAGLAAAGIESPITVWNGTAYSIYTPGIDTYILQPFEAFFIQKAEGGAQTVAFDPEYLLGN